MGGHPKSHSLSKSSHSIAKNRHARRTESCSFPCYRYAHWQDWDHVCCEISSRRKHDHKQHERQRFVYRRRTDRHNNGAMARRIRDNEWKWREEMGDCTGELFGRLKVLLPRACARSAIAIHRSNSGHLKARRKYSVVHLVVNALRYPSGPRGLHALVLVVIRA